jgi:hypothetical protein
MMEVTASSCPWSLATTSSLTTSHACTVPSAPPEKSHRRAAHQRSASWEYCSDARWRSRHEGAEPAASHQQRAKSAPCGGHTRNIVQARVPQTPWGLKP